MDFRLAKCIWGHDVFFTSRKTLLVYGPWSYKIDMGNFLFFSLFL